MNFQVNTDKAIDASNGTSLQGYIHVGLAALIARLGDPVCLDDYKSDAEWVVLTSSVLCFSIYNYKNGKNYLGRDGLATREMKTWNIGGDSPEVLHHVRTLFPGNKVESYTERWNL